MQEIHALLLQYQLVLHILDNRYKSKNSNVDY